ncbi:NUDIX domain-containing protein [Estrella lausannensis]
MTDTWQMVSEGVHEGEMAYQAAFREIREETGFSQGEVVLIFSCEKGERS